MVSPLRYWTIDWLVDRFGRVRSFGDLNAAWMGDRPASAAAQIGPEVLSLLAGGSNRSQRIQKRIESVPAR
jgi:hypothetical protein